VANGFADKGEPGSRVQVDCTGGALSACPRGSKLVLRIDSSKEPAFVHAYAEPADPSRERVWYFPAVNGSAPRIEPGPDPRVLEKGIVIGPEHASGAYRVHVLLSRAPLSRQEVLSAPRHPYTQGLLRCIPVPGRTKRRSRLGTIPGLVPNLIGNITGCAFRNRCAHAAAICAEPVEARCEADHLWRCVLAELPAEAA